MGVLRKVHAEVRRRSSTEPVNNSINQTYLDGITHEYVVIVGLQNPHVDALMRRCHSSGAQPQNEYRTSNYSKAQN